MKYLYDIFSDALVKIGAEGADLLYFEEPKNQDFGDFSTNIAMKLAKQLKKSPITIANEIINNLEYNPEKVSNISVAGAGFINIKLSEKYWTELLSEILIQRENFGKNTIYSGKTANVEYVSVNPTGLLHIGHGRNAVVGDTVANLLEWTGYDVTREYYFNNAGNQMKVLADSIYARYMQLFVDKDFPFPEDGYYGDYVKEIASDLYKSFGDKLKKGDFQDLSQIRKFGENWCFQKIKATLEKLNIKQDVFFNEDSLYKEGKIKELIEYFKSNNLAYEKDGALWLALSRMGLQEDRVIVKSSGEPTYRLPDIAYHREKFERNFDLIVDLFGADHIATYPDVLAALKAMGYDTDKIKVLIHQFVTLTENGEQVKMSKRTGKSYTLDELIDEVGPDVVRFFLLMRSINTHLEFDLSLAKEQSEKNPVFYLQYAHARICSIIDKIKNENHQIIDNPDLSVLTNPDEQNLIKQIYKFPSIILQAANKFEPYILAEYLKEVASEFHIFYHNCRIIGSQIEIASARYALCEATRFVLANGLSILGVAAPEKM
ncbi:MAG TPA: arginine--tRNA ligase [Candidatus Kapabacteria bacterium]|nr:arginine--tRNA ligase [Candidatus Kapabacteria bacterium]HOM04123.1 arginine--tRNA ligase [Candidatus Kapabacteria bacterium]